MIAQDFEVFAGNSFVLQIPILDADGSPAILTNPTGYWEVAYTPYPLPEAVSALLKDSDGSEVSVVQVGDTWTMNVTVSASDTQSIDPGLHYHESRIVDGAVTRTIAVGVMNILPTMIRT
jgi:hypothetical protein